MIIDFIHCNSDFSLGSVTDEWRLTISVIGIAKKS